MSDRRVSKEELEAFWRGDKNTYQKMYSQRMLQKANQAEQQGKQVTYVPNDGSGTLPEFVVTAPKETEELKQVRLNKDYENLADDAITVAGFVPGLDTVADIADISNSWRKGDYSGMLWGLAGLGLPVSGKALKSGWNWTKNILAGLSFKTSKDRLNTVNKLFRTKEWYNFLLTKNGDFYYRILPKEGVKIKSPEEHVFLSHTTPWDEFSHMKGVLYEFPTKTFGEMKASSEFPTAPYRDVSVIDQGKNHLLYGNKSSGKRGFVKVMDDETSKILQTDPYIIGISDRPMKNSFRGILYDTHPEYENIHLGHLTYVKVKLLNNALENSEYMKYNFSDSGIQKTLHIGNSIKQPIDIYSVEFKKGGKL